MHGSHLKQFGFDLGIRKSDIEIEYFQFLISYVDAEQLNYSDRQ